MAPKKASILENTFSSLFLVLLVSSFFFLNDCQGKFHALEIEVFLVRCIKNKSLINARHSLKCYSVLKLFCLNDFPALPVCHRICALDKLKNKLRKNEFEFPTQYSQVKRI